MARRQESGVSGLAFDAAPGAGGAAVGAAEPRPSQVSAGEARPVESAQPARVRRSAATIENIQLLRALAASGVVAFHSTHAADHYGYEVGNLLGPSEWGAQGVDVFFVISGFVMVYTQALNPRSSAAFLGHRLRRIVPVYWSLTALWLASVYFVPSLFRDNSIDISYSLSSFAFLTMVAEDAKPILEQGWTLEFEMLFYGLFAAAILLGRANNALVVSLILSALVFFEITDGIAVEFIIGVFIGQVYVHAKGGSPGSVSYPFFVVAGLLLPAMVFLGDQERVVLWGLPSALIVLGCCYLPQLRNRVLLVLGAASYSIYLVQAMSIPLFFQVSQALQVPAARGVELAVAGLLFTILVGTLLHLLYEKPVDAWLRRRFFASG